ncbi:hypothetical protein LWI29_000811 [Acer saccharum]|uniref:Uncharacterized protein n=1 Tax=Acer saccharum TaxID=4024 RepID=A0AA39RJQ3_ACESA|nr:hypothetical protein LWI29_000811 [Acer saccharum]
MARWADRLCYLCMVSGNVNEMVRLDSPGKHNCALPLDGPLCMQRVSSAMARTATGKRPRVGTSDKGKQKALPNKHNTRTLRVDRGWGGYVARPPRPNRGIVAEYYASTVPERLLVGGPVLVQGVEVHITPKAINQYFDAPEVAIGNGRGIEYIVNLDPYRGRVAAGLRMDGQEEWAGIDVSAGLENHDPSMMNLTNWNQQLVLRGLPPIGNYGERRRRREEREAREAEAATLLQDQPQGAPHATQLGGA